MSVVKGGGQDWTVAVGYGNAIYSAVETDGIERGPHVPQVPDLREKRCALNRTHEGVLYIEPMKVYFKYNS